MLGVDLDRPLGVALYVGDALRSIFIVHANARHNTVCPHLQIAGFESGRQSGRNRAEHGAYIASIDAIPAVMARRPVVMHLG